MRFIPSPQRKLLAGLIAFAFITASIAVSGCSLLTGWLPEQDKPGYTDNLAGTEHTSRDYQTTTKPRATPTPEPRRLFSNQARFLEHQGIQLPRMKSTSSIEQLELIDILAQIYELIAGEIDTSLMNPDYGASEGIRKLTSVGVYYDDSYYNYSQDPHAELSYSDVSYWIFEVRKKLLESAVPRTNSLAYPTDLLGPINISSALYTWQPDSVLATTFELEELLGPELLDQAEEPLSRLAAAHMMVRAYEAATEKEIPVFQEFKLPDTPDVYALKATNFFIWPENDAFMPDLQGKWDDDYFIGTFTYDSQLNEAIDGYAKKCPYGAVLSALTALLDSVRDIEIRPEQMHVVLNERPYPWHIYQIDTGEYGDVNCMPSCIEMSMLYQDLNYVPSAESLREIYPLDGLGWTDIMAEELMLEYGLEFADDYVYSYEDSIDDMLNYLDKGNILYVMFRDEYVEEGHAVIIKGYRQGANKLEFIISDPNQTQIGPYGYPEYTTDARKIVEDIIRHVPRYFIIPPGD